MQQTSQGPPKAEEPKAPEAEEARGNRDEAEERERYWREQQEAREAGFNPEHAEEDERSTFSSPGRHERDPDVLALMGLLVQNQIDSSTKHSVLLERLTDAQKEQNRPKTTTEKPNLTATFGEKLRLELKDFETWLNEQDFLQAILD